MLKRFSLLAAGIAMFLAACTTAPVSLSSASTYISPNDTVTEIGPASGSAYQVLLFGIPGGEIHQIGPALDRALKSSGGDALIGPKVEFHSYNLGVVVIFRTDVYGTAVKIRKGGNRG